MYIRSYKNAIEPCAFYTGFQQKADKLGSGWTFTRVTLFIFGLDALARGASSIVCQSHWCHSSRISVNQKGLKSSETPIGICRFFPKLVSSEVQKFGPVYLVGETRCKCCLCWSSNMTIQASHGQYLIKNDYLETLKI